jgi:hypothetical protein
MAMSPLDSLYVVGANKTVVFSPSQRYVREFDTPDPGLLGASVALLANGGLIVPSSLGSAGRAGLPLHHVSPDGTLLASFGAQVPVLVDRGGYDM